MKHHIAGLDHVLIGVADLDGGKAAYERLGFTVTPRGRHIGWGTGNYCVMFEDDYLELLGIIDSVQFTNNLDVRLRDHGEGMFSFAPAVGDVEAARASLAQSGFHPGPVESLKRYLDLPEGTVTPAFELLRLPQEEVAGLPFFFCRHLTPDLVRQPDWLRHENGALGIRAVHILTPSPERFRPPFARLLGDGAVREDEGMVTARIGACRFEFGRDDAVFDVFPGVTSGAPADDAAPVFTGLTIEVESLGRTRSVLEAGRVLFQEARDAVIVAPEAATGVALRFVEASG